MGIYDRDYSQHEYRDTSGPQIRFALPALTPVVKWLLIINVAVFVPFYMITTLRNFLFISFSVFPASLGKSLQLWRLVSYQFLHNPEGLGHIFFNMLTLFFFGPMLERLWGSRRFLVFYLVCGAMGGLLYTVLVLVRFLAPPLPLIGASGAILGMIAAAAIMFPKARVYVMGIFPIQLWVLAVILALISIMTLFRHENAGGEVAHLAGMAAGAAYVLSRPWWQRLKARSRTGRWESKIARQRALELQLDSILEKIHQHGAASLTQREKKILQEATKAEQMRDKF